MSFIDGPDGWFDPKAVCAVRAKQSGPDWFVVVELSNGIGMCADGPLASKEEAVRAADRILDRIRIGRGRVERC